MKKIFIFILLTIILQGLIFCDLYKLKYEQEDEEMAFELVTSPTGGSPENVNDYNAQNQILQALLYSLMSKTKHLTEWDTLNIPQMAAGTYVQHGGALFLGNSNTAIGGAPANGRVYIKVTRAGDALTFTFVNSAAGYSWNDAYCGFYHADGTQLLPYVLYLTASGYHKYTLKDSEDKFDITALIHHIGVIDIGIWDMDTTNTVDIAFDDILTALRAEIAAADFLERVIVLRVGIQNDSFNNVSPLLRAGYFFHYDFVDQFSLFRDTGGSFDNVAHNDNTINRGHIHYLAKI